MTNISTLHKVSREHTRDLTASFRKFFLDQPV
jgi:hypothetical protein